MKTLTLKLVIILLVFAGFSSCIKKPVTPNNSSGNGTNDTIIAEVSYGSDSKQVYDLYLPENRDSTTPVIVMIHGGAWYGGQKEEMNSVVNKLRNKWPAAAIVNMNYRLASNANNIHHDEMMEDIQSVIGDIILHKDDYQVSTNMGIMGGSAGGQLSMIYAYNYNDFNNIKCVGNFFWPSIISDWDWYNSKNIWLGGNVGEILAEYVGQTWDTAVYDGVSPYWMVNANSQPTIIFHGTLDPIVPLYQSQWMRGRLNALGVTNEYYEYVAFHGLDDNQMNDALNKLVPFFKTYLE